MSNYKQVIEICQKASQGNLHLDDLYECLEKDKSEILFDRLEREWHRELRLSKYQSRNLRAKIKSSIKPSLKRAIFRAFFWENCLLGFCQLLVLGIVPLSQPIFQTWILNYYNLFDDKITKMEVYYYATYFSLVALIVAIGKHQSFRSGYRLGMRVRTACSALIYSKVLRLHKSVTGKSTINQLINLMNDDVHRFDYFFTFVHCIWIVVIQVSLVSYLMWRTNGLSALYGILSFIFLSVPFQLLLINCCSSYTAKIAVLTKKRIQFLHEFISGIKAVKINAWEKPFENLSKTLRVTELIPITSMFSFYAFSVTSMDISARLTLFTTLIIYIWSGLNLSAVSTFEAAAYFSILQVTVCGFLPEGFIQYGRSCESVKRIEELLLLEELNAPEAELIDTIPSPRKEQIYDDRILKPIRNSFLDEHTIYPVRIDLHEVSAKWTDDQDLETLSNISLKVEAGSIFGVNGSAGSGKTTLLQLILNEIYPRTGVVVIQHGNKDLLEINHRSGYYTDNPNLRISYASQEAWLISGTIKDNITFGDSYDERRYREVVQVCGLLNDFQQLPKEDLTIIGEGGVPLSAEQSARVHLARAIYREADLYLIDDLFSSINVEVGQHLINKCILKYLEGKTRIFVTRRLEFLRSVDTLVFIDQGTIKNRETFEELETISPSLVYNEKSSNEEQLKNYDTISYRYKKENVQTSSKSVSSSELQQGVKTHQFTRNKEEVTKRNVGMYVSYFKMGGTRVTFVLFAVITVGSLVFATGFDYWSSYWTNLEEFKQEYNKDKKLNSSTIERNVINIKELKINKRLSTVMSIYVYSSCAICCLIFCWMRNYLTVNICLSASRNVYASMFSNILNTTLDFYNANPSGKILNRFSKDIEFLDKLMPIIAVKSLQIFLGVLTAFILVFIIDYFIAIPFIILGTIAFIVSGRYLLTAYSLKRLEDDAKSLVYSHTRETINGLTTIRSYGKDVIKKMKKEFHNHQDNHTRVWYLLINTSTSYSLCIEFLCACFMTCVVFFVVVIFSRGDIFPGYVGLSITESLIFALQFPYGLNQLIAFVSNIASVERVLNYNKLSPERLQISVTPIADDWPTKGCLEFRNFSMAYDNTGPFVLKDLNLVIEPGMKVAIVGARDSGKCSIVSALLRLTDHLKGKIIIDDVDTTFVGLEDLRSRISVIPQEPVLFSQTLRYNLDPLGQYADEKLLETLQIVELEYTSLDQQVMEEGSNFSPGKRQLICLARAILRNNCILIVEEDTSNIDSTQVFIQKKIQTIFADCTVLTIAHTVSTVMNSDRVLFLNSGNVMEYDHPEQLLLDNPNGFFAKLLKN